MIPKKLAPGATAYVARPGEHRPWTLANTAQKLVLNAVDTALSAVAAHIVHEAQTGFVRGRSMLANFPRLEGAIEEHAFDPRDEAGIFLVDVASTFPSIGHAWLWRVLRTLRIRPQSLRFVCALYLEAAVHIAGVGATLPVCVGAKPGCPMLGTIWASAYDPIVRSIIAAAPKSLGRLGVFADDLGLAARYRFEGMLALEPDLGDRVVAANLRPKTLARTSSSTSAATPPPRR